MHPGALVRRGSAASRRASWCLSSFTFRALRQMMGRGYEGWVKSFERACFLGWCIYRGDTSKDDMVFEAASTRPARFRGTGLRSKESGSLHIRE